jgi:hypothetical protein
VCIANQFRTYIPPQECVPPILSNSLLVIVTKLGQRVAQDPCIHGHLILNLWAFLPSKWASGLTRLHNHIMACLQMPYQVVLGHIGCITPINPTSNFWPILCPMDTFYGNQGKGNVATLTLGSWPRQGFAKVHAKREARESHLMLWGVTPHALESVGKCERMNPTPPNELPLWELPPWTPNLQRVILGVKTHWIETFLISLKISWNLMSKMGSHDPFGHF